MNDAQHQAVTDYLRRAADQMQLRDWEIILRRDPEPHDAWASIEVCRWYATAWVRVAWPEFPQRLGPHAPLSTVLPRFVAQFQVAVDAEPGFRELRDVAVHLLQFGADAGDVGRKVRERVLIHECVLSGRARWPAHANAPDRDTRRTPRSTWRPVGNPPGSPGRRPAWGWG